MEEKHGERLLVLYASQTGNAMDAAERVGREAERGGCPSVSVFSMDDFDPILLPDEHTVVFIVSTTGQGDAPDSMKAFWRFLLQRNLSHQWLEGLQYAVFGLGDSSYQKYNFTAKKLDKRLSDLGAKPIVEKGLGDDQHRSGYEGAFDPWLVSLWNKLNELKPAILPRVSDILDAQIKKLDAPTFQITYHRVDEAEEHLLTIPDLDGLRRTIERTRLMSAARHRHDDIKPHYFLRMIKNQCLTKAGDRDVRHFEFEAVSSDIRYQAGDVLEILPRQNPIAVDAFIRRCNLDPDCYIKVQPRSNKKQSSDQHANGFVDSVKLKTFVELTMDVASASPRR